MENNTGRLPGSANPRCGAGLIGLIQALGLKGLSRGNQRDLGCFTVVWLKAQSITAAELSVDVSATVEVAAR